MGDRQRPECDRSRRRGHRAVTSYPMPAVAEGANLNTAAFDGDGILWFTGQAGMVRTGRPGDGQRRGLRRASRSRSIRHHRDARGDIYYASLAGSYLGAVDTETGQVTVLEPPTAGAGVRRAWSDSSVGSGSRVERRPGRGLRPDRWVLARVATAGRCATGVRGLRRRARRGVADRFRDRRYRSLRPGQRDFQSFPPETTPSAVRQLLGRDGEVWGAESAADRLVVVRYE